jgi:hypothetical protein
LWRNERKERTSLYDCEICSLGQNEWFRNRKCFHPLYGEEVFPFKLPYFDEETKKMIPGETNEQVFTQEEFLEWLYEVNERYFPDQPSFEFIQGAFKARNGEVCLTAFIDESLGELVDLESHCEAYHELPYDGGIFNQPQLFLDAFSIIRTERNRYEKVRADKMMKNLKTGSGSGSTTKKPANPMRSGHGKMG